jgi:hypothetical protein
MKQIVIAVAALMVAASAYAQGTLNFATKVTGQVDAKVLYAGTGEAADGTFWGQLYAGPVGGTLAAVGTPQAFRSPPSVNAGYILGGGTVSVPTVAGGSPASVELRAWAGTINGTMVSTYENALALGQGGTGISAPVTITTGNPNAQPVPGLPANLTGLTGFSIQTIVPEPSIAALGLLGAGLLLIRRKK